MMPSYETEYQRSLSDPAGFWAEKADILTWHTPPQKTFSASFHKEDFHIKWYEGGTLNLSENCLDRHLETRSHETALIFEPDVDGPAKTYTFQEMHKEVCQIANHLRGLGIKKGDRVTLYMPMIPEAIFSMLACARIGAIHAVVFGGFSAASLADRLDDCESALLITADQGQRGGKIVPLKENVDKALSLSQKKTVQNVLVFQHTGATVSMEEGRDLYAHALPANADCPAVEMGSEDPLFILYTSGSTGKPKGVLHTTGGYGVYTTHTFKDIFDYKPGERYWCTADVGWITGHSYLVYGPLLNGATLVVHEGVPNYPDAGRIWQIVEKHKVNILYTAPTAIRSLMAKGDAHVTAHDRSSLRILGTVGEPINPTAWTWYKDVVGENRCPVVDTWWQTETGGILISPLPQDPTRQKAGSVTKPFYGIQPALLDEQGQEIEGAGEGALVIKHSWPGQMRTVYGDPDRFFDTYFTTYPGYYFSGDRAMRDEAGDYWIRGRMDDVVNISGHRLGTAEVESALNTHNCISETAVVGIDDPLTSQALMAFVTLKKGKTWDAEAFPNELNHILRDVIGPIAKVKIFVPAGDLPKTRSGKIIRRILRKLSEGQGDQLGDLSTLANPQCVEDIQKTLKVGKSV